MSRWRRGLSRLADAVAEWPLLRRVAEPVHRRRFLAHRRGNAYWGVYATYEEALAAIPPGVTTGYDSAAAADLYEDRLTRLEASDYPAMFWLSRLLARGMRSIVDLGGHVGVSYYAFARHLDYPDDLRWQVHDVPAISARGRELAAQRGAARQLSFVGFEAIDGCDVLMAKGALQYLDYSLAERLHNVQKRPKYLLVNLTPMHAQSGFFTLQHIGVAICPYRISGLRDFLAEIAALGYVLEDHWHDPERRVNVPFHPACEVDRYHGFCFRLGDGR